MHPDDHGAVSCASAGCSGTQAADLLRVRAGRMAALLAISRS
jgi:hypothetical protein